MPRSISYNKSLIRHLKNPKEAAAYLDAILEENNPELFLKALKKVAEARGGMSRLAAKSRISRVGLYKAFSNQGNPGIKTLGNVLKAFHLRLAVNPR